MNYDDGVLGSILDFRAADTKNSRGYYLGDLLACAKNANYTKDGYTNAQLQSNLGNLNYTVGLVAK